MLLKTAERIHALREQAGMTQNDLASELNVTRSTVQSWEVGASSPTTEKIADMTLIFKTSADYILGTDSKQMLRLDNLTAEQQTLLYRLTQYLEKSFNIVPEKTALAETGSGS